MTGKYYLLNGTSIIINEGQTIHVELVSGVGIDFEGNKLGKGLKNLTYEIPSLKEASPEVKRVGPVMERGNKEQLRDGVLIEAT